MRVNQTAGPSRSHASLLIAPNSRSQLTFSSITTRSPEARSASMKSRLSCQIIAGSSRGNKFLSLATPGGCTHDETECQRDAGPIRLVSPRIAVKFAYEPVFHGVELFSRG